MIKDWVEHRRIGIYGNGSHDVIVLHGGPGAYGGSDPVAIELSDCFKTYSPWQRKSGNISLSVDVHVEDLKDLIQSKFIHMKPALIGESWGAMLALAFACKYPNFISSLVLVGCGTYSEETRRVLTEMRKKRIDEYIEKHPEFKSDSELPFMNRVIKWHEMTDTFCAREVLPASSNVAEEFDQRGFEETWNDMLRCQKEDIYPQQFVNITCPVLMLHGTYDPHPGTLIMEHLKQFIPQLEYKEFAKCGHAPSIEKHARDEFFRYLKSWLSDKFLKRTRQGTPSSLALK